MSSAYDEAMAKLAHLRSSADAKAHFDQWAPQYDQDFIERFGYIGPGVIGNALSRDQIDRASSILDVGCGTGLVGEELKKRGYLTLYGADISDGMRAEAEKKNIYRRLIAADFSKRTGILDGIYDVLVTADTFGPGQLSAAAFPELIRLVRRTGHIYALVQANYFETENLADAISEYEQRGLWKLDRVMSANVMKHALRPAKLIVARRS